MDYSKLFEPTFFLALTFLGIVVPIFSLSISLLGHAVEKAKEKSIERRRNAEQELQKEFDNLDLELKKIKGGKDKLAASQDIENKLKQLKKSRKNFDKESTKIINRYDRLKFGDGVLFPGFLFLMAVVSNSIAQGIVAHDASFECWIISLILIALGIYKICSNLSIIQEVALSSDKYQQERMYEAISRAFETQARLTQPEIQLIFITPAPPFKFPKSSEISLSFKARLTKGKIAKDVKILFVISKEFDFVNVNRKWNQAANYDIPNGLSAYCIMGDVRRGLRKPASMLIKTPSVSGMYKMFCVISSEEFNKKEEFEVEII